jgi:hypothetical protein
MGDKMKKKYKITISILLIMASIVLILLYVKNLSLLNSFKKKESGLNELVSEIKNYKKIKQISFNEKYSRNSLNEKYYESEKEKIDTLKLYLNHKIYFIDDLLKEENIDKTIFDKFKNKLIELDLNNFYVYSDSTIVFHISDGRYGIIYDKVNSSEFNEPIYHRRKLAENWYYWSF